MRCLALLALAVSVLAMGAVPGHDRLLSAPAAAAEARSGGGAADREVNSTDRRAMKKSGKSAAQSSGGSKAGKAAAKSRDAGRSAATPSGRGKGKGKDVDGRRDGSRDATSRPARDRVTADPGVEPEIPVDVDDPIPKPRDPDPTVPVRVDDPVPTPRDPEPEPTTPVEPSPDDSDGGVVVEGPTTTPTAPDGSGIDRPGSGSGSKDDTQRLQARIDELLRRNRLEIPDSDDGRAPAVEVVTPVAPTPEVAPVLEPAPAAVAEVPSEAPAETAQSPAVTAAAEMAPRIALSSGGGGSTYRQHEISVLGLTPRARQVIGALGFRILSERRSPLLGNRVVARLRTPGDQTSEVAIERVRQVLPELTFDFAHLYRPSGNPVPVRYPAEMVGAPAPGACRVDARIGLIDSGVGKHRSLANADITRRNFVAKDAATNVAHGTAIASILVGELPGSGPLAPGARVFSANVFAQDANGLRADAHAIIEALDWMAAQQVPVINLSLMGPPDALLQEAVQAATHRGQILVAAAGNDGPGAGPAYPAAYPAVIAVAAVDARGRPYGRNNRGSYVYVSAPGVDVWGADARGGQAFWTGTSFAAPFVTATLARDVAVGRAHDINDGRARIAASARDLGAPGRDPIYGYGLLQVGGCSGNAAPVLSSKN